MDRLEHQMDKNEAAFYNQLLMIIVLEYEKDYL